MADRENVVEVPLDPQYLTPDGFYAAGYLWGRHIRSVDDGLPQGATDMFKQGVEDGYGDGMAKNMEKIQDWKKPVLGICAHGYDLDNSFCHYGCKV